MEQSRCSKNRVSCEHVFPPRCLQATDPSNGVDATRGSNSVGENGVSTPYLGSARASLNGVFSLLVTSLNAGVSESELVLVASSERRMSGVWNDGASMVVFPEMSGAVGGPRMDENAERRKEERVECLGPERLEAVVEDMRRCPSP
jgi:hypothetical protein